jgi:pimeloyl-ACP methyl ester carboxylesterase
VLRRRLVHGGLVATLAMSLAVPLTSVGAAQAAPGPAHDVTTPTEAKRVDRVPTPKLDWYDCYGRAQCATAKLPLDYDAPTGPKVEVALLRIKARKPAQRIGSLFLNPGGPGGSGTEIAYFAPLFLDPALLDRFDIVGMDPRGTNFSDQVKCFPGNKEQGKALAGLASNFFPYTKAEEAAAVASAKAMGRACSTTGRPLSASMSTAEVARDMDVMRRAVGDKKLSYLGFSYGSYLGQVYANLFPDRVRAVVIDGVLDPLAWAGTAKTASIPQTDRLRSADGAWKALREILVRCDKVGGTRCRFAPGDPVANYDLVARRLKAKPLVLQDPFTGEAMTFTYADLVGNTLGDLYSQDGYRSIISNLSELIIITEPPATGAAAAQRRAAAQKAFVKRLKARDKPARSRWGFPYNNGFEAFASVLCTDGLNPRHAESWPAYAAAADKRAKYFGRLWTWSSVQCASATWTAKDEDAYRGPFTRRTVAPVLVVGNYWDPATNYSGAVAASRLLPNSRLLSSDSWGHTALGSSLCVDSAVSRYLLTQVVPAKGTVCKGAQPFESAGPPGPGSSAAAKAPARARPPVVPIIPAG